MVGDREGFTRLLSIPMALVVTTTHPSLEPLSFLSARSLMPEARYTWDESFKFADFIQAIDDYNSKLISEFKHGLSRTHFDHWTSYRIRTLPNSSHPCRTSLTARH